MKNKDTIKDLARLCKEYGLKIMKEGSAEDEYLMFLAWNIYASANEIMKEFNDENSTL